MKLGSFSNPDFIAAFTALVSMEMPIKAAYRLSKIQITLADENKKFDELRKKIIEKYAVKDKEGNVKFNEDNSVKFETKKIPELTEELQNLFDLDFEVGKVQLADLGDVKISAKSLLLLTDLIED